VILQYVEGKVHDILAGAQVTRLAVGHELVWFRTSRSRPLPLVIGDEITVIACRLTASGMLIAIRIRRHRDRYDFRLQMHSSTPLQIAAWLLLKVRGLRHAGEHSLIRQVLAPLVWLGQWHLEEQQALIKSCSREATTTAQPAPPVSKLQPTLPRGAQQANTNVPLGQQGAAPTAESPWWHSDLLEHTHDAIIIWEMDGGGILYWNQAAERLYGYSRDEAYGKVTHDLLHTVTIKPVKELETLLARYGVWVGELRHTTRDHRRITVEGRLSLMSQRNGRWLVLEVNRDMTDRKQAEAAANARTTKLSTLNGGATD
jgi:PAS domain S-box-containing protein